VLNSQGLGEQVQRKKEAYQGNPQALQQRYQESQQLVDLLALQQLKSEKEAVARNMQMQMQQNPATIAQQREQEVLGMIKQEQGRKLGDVAQRTAGTLGQINKKAQQNMQRTAKQGLPAMGGPQRSPANAPQKPAMMAGGGIVAFSNGMSVSAPEKPGFFSQFSLPDMDAVRRREERIEKEKERLRALGVVIPENITTEEVVDRINTALADPVTKQRLQEEEEKETTAKAVEETPNIGGPSKPKAPSGGTASGIMLRDAGVKPAATQPQGLEALGLTPPTPTPTVVGTQRQDIAQTLIDELGIKPEGTREEARQAAEERTKGILDAAIGREEGELGPKESQLQRMQELQAQQTDPEKLRQERIQRGLIGMTGRSADTMFGGYAAGKFNQRVVQEAAARKNLTDQFGIENEKIQLDLDIANAQITSGQEAVEVLAKDQRAAAAAIQSAAADDVKMAIAAGDRAFESDMQGAKTKLELFLSNMEDRRAAAEQASDKELAYAQLAVEFLQEKMQLETELMGDAGFDMADSPDDVNAAITRLETMTVQFHQMLEKAGINDFESSIQKRAGALSGSGNKTPSGIDMNPDLTALVDRYAQ
tara:strand:- start:2506 stop:4287 length:1782 start_codon:yes stop_codon:yes gene_type:complete